MDAQKKWKIKKANGDIYGPIKTDIVITWISDGRISPNDLIAEEGSKDWQRIKDVPPFKYFPFLIEKEQKKPKIQKSEEEIIQKLEEIEAISSEEKGFIGSLFDFTFTHFITISFIKILYGFVIFIAAITAIATPFIINRVMESKHLKAIGTLRALIISPIIFFLIIFFERIFLETIAVLFRINEHLFKLVKFTKKKK